MTLYCIACVRAFISNRIYAITSRCKQRRISKLGKNSKSVFDFLTYSKKTEFSFSYAKVEDLDQAIEASNEIDRISKFDNSFSFGAKQKSLGQIFFKL